MTTSRDGQIVDADRRTARSTSRSGYKWIRWTARMKREFLDALAATCNVKAAALGIGVAPTSVHKLRRRDEAFAREWAVALRQGYETLELHLVGHALAGGESGSNGILDTGDPTGSPINVELGLKLLREHRNRAAGKHEVGGVRPHVATRQQTNAAILKKLSAIEARIARETARTEGVADDRPGGGGAPGEP